MIVSRKSTERVLPDPDDAPELTGEELTQAGGRWKIAGKPVSAAKGKAAFRATLGKRQVNMMLDNAVVAHFKARAGRRGYQTLINEALKEAISRETLEATLRRLLREELQRR
jgi:uncharacterized protein (DUF4415 family)